MGARTIDVFSEEVMILQDCSDIVFLKMLPAENNVFMFLLRGI